MAIYQVFEDQKNKCPEKSTLPSNKLSKTDNFFRILFDSRAFIIFAMIFGIFFCSARFVNLYALIRLLTFSNIMDFIIFGSTALLDICGVAAFILLYVAIKKRKVGI